MDAGHIRLDVLGLGFASVIYPIKKNVENTALYAETIECTQQSMKQYSLWDLQNSFRRVIVLQLSLSDYEFGAEYYNLHIWVLPSVTQSKASFPWQKW